MSPNTGQRPRAVQQTKLHRPALPRDVLRRDSLLELMAGAGRTPATLVCAPAGYGKSLLVSQWLEEERHDHVWLSLDEGESDLRQFLTYVVAGIQGVVSGSCEETRSLVEATELPDLEALARCFSNDLGLLGSPLVLVFDDYHRLAAPSSVHDLLTRLFEHPSRDLHVVLIARHDPPLEFAKLRARALLTEIRTRDLRFTAAQSAELLTTSAGIDITAEALENLHQQLEGWAVGLRLVLAALRYTNDADSLLLGLQGGISPIQEYLVQEVLSAFPAELRQLVEVAALFERFSPELLEEVMGPDIEPEERHDPIARFWELIGQGHLLVIPLDAEGRWKRYHHELRDYLRMELENELSDTEIHALHRRASAWFERAGEIDEALDHALAADDANLAADIIARHRHAVSDQDRWFVVERWLDRLPPQLETERPDLMVARVMFLAERHEAFAMAALAEQVASRLDDPQADPALRSELDVRLGQLDVFFHGDGKKGRDRLERARRHLPNSSLVRGEHGFYLAAARQLIGEGEAAMEALAQQIRVTDPSEVDLLSRLIGGQGVVGLWRGDLVGVSRSATRLLDLVRDGARLTLEAWGWYLEGAARFHRDELEEGARALEAAAARPHVLQKRVLLDALAASAYCHQRLGRDGRVDSLLDQLERLTRGSEPHLVDVVDSCRARLQLRCGDLASAAAWARSFERDLHPSSILFLLEVPVITQIRVWIESGTRADLAQALDRLDPLRAMVTELHFDGQRNEIETLHAVALAKLGRREEALDIVAPLLERVLSQGQIRPLAEAGPALAELIHALDRRRRGDLSRAELDHLLGALEAPVGTVEESSGSSGRPVAATVPLLTHRELDVLESVTDRLQDKEIAVHLGISTHTVKDHLKRIYRKLGVSGRREAESKAMSLGLVEESVERRPHHRA